MTEAKKKTKKTSKIKKESAKKQELGSRALWTGTISFGLINIPIRLFPAEKSTDLHFHLIDSKNLSKIHYERINDETGKKVAWEDVVRGFEYEPDKFVIVEEEELKKAVPESTQTIAIENFIDKSEIDSIYFEKPYYILPSKGGEKGYALLQKTLTQANKIGLARVVIRTKQHLCALLPYEDKLILNLLRYPSELRPMTAFQDQSKAKTDVTKQEIEIAKKLVDMLSVKWKPEKYHDTFKEVLMQYIDKKIKHGKTKVFPKTTKEEKPTSNVVDFMSLLKKSLKEKQAKKPAKHAAKR